MAAKTSASTRIRPKGAPVRQTRPSNWNPNQGGLRIIPRQGLPDPRIAWNRQQLQTIATTNPLRLLTYLIDVDPALSLATWTLLRLSCKPDDLRIVAVPPGDNGGDSSTEDEFGTGRINELWRSQPPEVGGLLGLQTTLMLHTWLSGQPMAEAVPGKRLEGLRRVWPVDPLTIGFGRDSEDSDITAYQRQFDAQPLGWKRLNPETFLWRQLDGLADNPHGRAPAGAAVAEILRDLSLMQDLNDALHNVGFPRYTTGFDFVETYKLAREQFGMSADEAGTWVMEQFEAVQEAMSNMNADDNPVVDVRSKVTILEGGAGLGNIPEILKFLRQRIMQALKTLPTLMGVNESGAQAHTTVDWQIYAAGIETMRCLVFSVLVDIATLHLRLLGLPLVAKAIYEPIRTTDAFVEAQTEAIKMKNEIVKREQGFISHDQAGMAITGNKPHGEPINRNAGLTSSSEKDDATLPNEGTKKEEKDAQKGRPA